jgi:hypothetical protein
MSYTSKSFGEAFQAGAEGLADGICEDINSVLSEPIERALMAADRVDAGRLEIFLRRIAAALRGEAVGRTRPP